MNVIQSIIADIEALYQRLKNEVTGHSSTDGAMACLSNAKDQLAAHPAAAAPSQPAPSADASAATPAPANPDPAAS